MTASGSRIAPTTAAGRALLRRGPTALKATPSKEREAFVLAAILAIEAEAAQAERERVRERVRAAVEKFYEPIGPPAESPYRELETTERLGILAILDAAEQGEP